MKEWLPPRQTLLVCKSHSAGSRQACEAHSLDHVSLALQDFILKP